MKKKLSMDHAGMPVPIAFVLIAVSSGLVAVIGLVTWSFRKCRRLFSGRIKGPEK